MPKQKEVFLCVTMPERLVFCVKVKKRVIMCASSDSILTVTEDTLYYSGAPK